MIAESSEDPDIAAFVGDSHLGASILVFPVEGAPRLGYLTAMERQEAAATGLDLLQPEILEVDKARSEHGSSADFWAAVVERALHRAGLAPATVAVAGRSALGTAHCALRRLESQGWRFTDGATLIRRHRKRKVGRELEEVRRAALGVCDAFHRAAAILAEAKLDGGALGWRQETLRVGVLRREISLVLAAHGLSQPKGNIVAAGATAGVPHSKGDDAYVLKPGETIVVDLFPKGALFADCTRTFCVGTIDPQVSRAFEQVKEALQAAHDGSRAGRRAWELQLETCERFERADYLTPLSRPGTSRGYVHGLGHGVGYELHEYPAFAKGSGEEGLLEVGDVFTLEPGLYDEEAGYGIRLENLCLLTEDGVENLTPLPCELDPRRWPTTGGTGS